MSHVLAHVKVLLLDLMRNPAAVVANIFFPTGAYIFVILPQRGLRTDPVDAATSLAQMAVFATLASYVFSYGLSAAEERANPWFSYLRTLPMGPLGSTLARFVVAVLAVSASLVPLLLTGALATPAFAAASGDDWWRVPAFLVAVLVGGIPFLGLAVVIGFTLTPRTAFAVAQITWPLAFLGGLFAPPEALPPWLMPFSAFTPARPARDLAVAVLGGHPVQPWTVAALAGWSLLGTAVAVAANRRDEGRRFR